MSILMQKRSGNEEESGRRRLVVDIRIESVCTNLLDERW